MSAQEVKDEANIDEEKAIIAEDESEIFSQKEEKKPEIIDKKRNQLKTEEV